MVKRMFNFFKKKIKNYLIQKIKSVVYLCLNIIEEEKKFDQSLSNDLFINSNEIVKIQQSITNLSHQGMINLYQGIYLTSLYKDLEEMWNSFFQSHSYQTISPYFAKTICSQFPIEKIEKFLFLKKNSHIKNKSNISKKPIQKICLILAMAPNPQHAGGLRFFDLITLISKSYDVCLYCSGDFTNNYSIYEKINKNLKFTRMVSWENFNHSDYKNWVYSNNLNFDLIYLSWADSVTIAPWDIFPQAQIIFEFIECNTLRYIDAIKSDVIFSSKMIEDFFLLFHFYSYEYEADYHSQATVFMTDDEMKFAKNHFHSKKTFLLPTCVSNFEIWNKLIFEKAEQIQKNQSVLFLGNYDHLPNKEGVIWYLENVHKSLCEKIPHYKFIIVGHGNLQNIRNNYSQYLNSSLEIRGPVEDLVQTIQSCKVCIAPLFSGSGIRGKINQYSACSRPTVATNLALKGLPYEHNQSIFEANNQIEFIEGISKLLTDENFYNLISTEAQKIVNNNFTMEIFHDKFNEIVATL